MLRRLLRPLQTPVCCEVAWDPLRPEDQGFHDLLEELPHIVGSELITVHSQSITSLTPRFTLRVARVADPAGSITFWGPPFGYQFGSLINAILDTARAVPRLATETLVALDRWPSGLECEVWVTPNCPHSPRAVRFAHQLALARPGGIRVGVISVQYAGDASGADEIEATPTTTLRLLGKPVFWSATGAWVEAEWVAGAEEAAANNP